MSKQQKDTYSTIKIPVEYSSTEDRMLISDMRRQQTHIIRSAFKKYEKGLPTKINSFDNYNDIDLLDSWMKNSAIKEGKAIYEAEKELQKSSEKKIRTCFGGKSLMNDYRSGKISKDELRAGRLSPLVSIGDIVVGSKAVEHDMNSTALGDKQGEVSFADCKVMYFECDKNASNLLAKCAKELPDTKVVQGIIASGDVFVSDRRKRLLLNDRFGAMACEMEGAAIGHTCWCCKTPFAILRAISDDMDENKGVDFVKFSSMAAEKTVSVIDLFTKSE